MSTFSPKPVVMMRTVLWVPLLCFFSLPVTAQNEGEIPASAFEEVFKKVFEGSQNDFTNIRENGKTDVMLPKGTRSKMLQDENGIWSYRCTYACGSDKEQALAYFKRLKALTEENIPDDYKGRSAPAGDLIKKRTWEFDSGDFSDIAKNPTVTLKVKKKEGGTYETIYTVQEPVFKP